MAILVVRTQSELDSLPDSFNQFTYIEIRSDSDNWIVVNKNRGSSQVRAYGSSQVRAYGSSQVRAYGSSQVRAYGSSQVTAYGSSQVRAYGSSQVTACGSSQVTAYGSSQVRAYGSSQVRAYGSSQVRAYGSSQVRAYGSSQVRAYGSSQVRAYGSSQVTACDSSQVTAYGSSQVTACGSSQVTAYGNSMVAVLSALVVLHKIAQYAIVALDGVKVKLPKKDRTATVIKRKMAEYDLHSFIDIYGLEIKERSVILYKSVHPETLCDFKTGRVKYEGIVECPDFDSNKDRECGGGLHLCATPELTQSFNIGKILKCKVLLKDIVVYGKDIRKVRCRRVEVLGAL